MDDPAASHIDCHMSRITDNVSRLCVLIADSLSA